MPKNIPNSQHTPLCGIFLWSNWLWLWLARDNIDEIHELNQVILNKTFVTTMFELNRVMSHLSFWAWVNKHVDNLKNEDYPKNAYYTPLNLSS